MAGWLPWQALQKLWVMSSWVWLSIEILLEWGQEPEGGGLPHLGVGAAFDQAPGGVPLAERGGVG